MTLIGMGYRGSLSKWIASAPPEIECVEITAEHFFDTNTDLLEEVTSRYPVFVHGLGLSLATAGPLDPGTLKNFRRIVEMTNPEWISEHIAFTRTEEVDLGHLNPIPPTQQMLDRMIGNAMALSKACDKPLILENITSHLKISGAMTETDFLNELCHQAGCGLLLDVTNLYINSKNHKFDPLEWLHRLNPASIVQLHIVGYSYREGRWHDSHCEPIQTELYELCKTIIEYAPVKAIIVERDDNFPKPQELEHELSRLKAICHESRSDNRSWATVD